MIAVQMYLHVKYLYPNLSHLQFLFFIGLFMRMIMQMIYAND